MVSWWLSDLEQHAERSGSYWSLGRKLNLDIKWEKEMSWKEGEKERPLFPMVSQWVGSAGQATTA